MYWTVLDSWLTLFIYCLFIYYQTYSLLFFGRITKQYIDKDLPVFLILLMLDDLAALINIPIFFLFKMIAINVHLKLFYFNNKLTLNNVKYDINYNWKLNISVPFLVFYKLGII